ncbi:MAG: acyltransferase [Methylotenera sp.]|nr:acyltransferase [Methylotenera sp.]
MRDRFNSLDGWRGISILFVLAGHLLPIGPKIWLLNGAVASAGMALFFILSGFLITNLLIKDQNIFNFLIRRFLRILPLAWLFIVVTFIIIGADSATYIAHLLFYANWPPMALTLPTAHFWSLCLEMQFYVGIALLICLLKRHVFLVLPILCLSITAFRYINGVEMAINTYYRADEILAGCILAIMLNSNHEKIKYILSKLSIFYLLPLLILSAHPASNELNYFRPYIALALVGSTLTKEKYGEKWLKCSFLSYMANISYALYIIHGGLMHTWLGSGDTLEKYMKRPLLLIATFALAHLSTFYYEKYWINLGKKLSKKTYT